MKQIDRIRNMNVEELASFICGIMANDTCVCCTYYNKEECCCEDYKCGEGIEDWLESEVESNDK